MKTGILLVNLGTPEAPTGRAVFRYLIEFLTDPRVIEAPWLQRQLLVRALITPFRYRNSTRAYQRIWTEAGSPLKVYNEKSAKLLQEALGGSYVVKLAMRYQNPSIKKTVKELMAEELQELIVLPLFPQYASATTGSIFEALMKELSPYKILPKITLIDHFYREKPFIQAFGARGRPFQPETYDHILFSFHGLPLSQLEKRGEPTRCYSNQCYATAEAIAKELHLDAARYTVCFQSRLGKAPWTSPSTQDVIEKLAKEGKKRLLVFCPSFVADCLETLYEIGVEYKELFLHAGGEKLDLVPSLNDSPEWIFALTRLIRKEEQNFPPQRSEESSS